MNQTETSQYISETFQGVAVLVDSGNSFFIYNPDSSLPPDYKFMFLTIMTSDDDYDQFSNLNRDEVFRLSMALSKQTFQSLFGTKKSENAEDSHKNYDFTLLDELMPHPTYGKMYWAFILNPSEETFKTKVQALLNEAYELVVSKYNKQSAKKK